MTILDIRNPLQINSLQSVLQFIDEAMSKLAKKTDNFKENPMKKHHINWLEIFKTIISSVTWQMHLLLGSKMQSYIAYTVLPTLLSIMETIRKIFNSYPSGDKQKQ